MQQFNLQEELGRYSTTTRVQKIKSNKYIVVSVYAGNKDFKKVFCDSAFRQVCADMKKSV